MLQSSSYLLIYSKLGDWLKSASLILVGKLSHQLRKKMISLFGVLPCQISVLWLILWTSLLFFLFCLILRRLQDVWLHHGLFY